MLKRASDASYITLHCHADCIDWISYCFLTHSAMYSHYNKDHFPALAVTVLGLMILSGVILLFGAVSAVYMMLSPIMVDMIDFIKISFGSIVIAFLIFAFAEFLEVLMKIEINTRKGTVKVPGMGRRK